MSMEIFREPDAVATTVYVDGFTWRCTECGWTGLGHTSSEAAIREAGRHWDEHHTGLPRPEIQLHNMTTH